MHVTYEHWLVFGGICVGTWLLVTYFWPRMLLYVFKRAILVDGFGDGPIPLNTIHAAPQSLFADPLHPPASASRLATTGVNRDTLMAAGWLDLRQGPLLLHVPDMDDRYYSVQLTDPSRNVNFAYVGKRATGTGAGVFLITRPGWKGQLPEGMKEIRSPKDAVLVLGRVLVHGDLDLPTAHELATRIRLAPLESR